MVLDEDAEDHVSDGVRRLDQVVGDPVRFHLPGLGDRDLCTLSHAYPGDWPSDTAFFVRTLQSGGRE